MILIVLAQTHDQVQIRPIRLWSQGAIWQRKTLESRLYVDGRGSIRLGISILLLCYIMQYSQSFSPVGILYNLPPPPSPEIWDFKLYSTKGTTAFRSLG